VTDDYPGAQPWRFTGGTIGRVAVDVSGEPYLDLERQAQMIIRSQ
jgi:arylsulfatase